MKIEASTRRNGEFAWFKSSYSDGEGGACVEVAAGPGTVHVRDSKDRQGPRLVMAPDGWKAFVSHVAKLG